MGPLRHAVGAVTAALLVVSACGGADSGTPPAADPTATAPTGQATSAPTPAPLAFVDLGVDVWATPRILLTPGESVVTDLVLHNRTDRARTVRFEVTTAVPHVEARPRVDRLRIRAGESVVAALVVDADLGLAAGVSGDLDVALVAVGEPARRTGTAIELVSVISGGSRPEAVDDIARTTTAELVTTYVLTNDTDADDDLDYGTFRVLGGAGLGVEVYAAAGGAVVYRPGLGINAVDHVLYLLCDKAGRCDTGVLTIDIDQAG